MSDQSHQEWKEDSSKGTLVVLSDDGESAYLAALTGSYSNQRFDYPDERKLVKFYFQEVEGSFVRSQIGELSKFEWTWIPDKVKDLFRGACSGDCSVSRTCAKPGCLCRNGRCR